MIENIEWLLQGVTVLILFGALISVVGIVWRVEAELDTAYKWFTVAVALSLLNQVTDLVEAVFLESAWFNFLPTLLHFLSAGALFLGMYYMRDLVRRMDGEKRG